MAQVFIRVELRGTPGGETYKQLHTHMRQLGWWTVIASEPGPFSVLPHAMYCGDTGDPIHEKAEALRASIMSNVWSKGAIVLVIQWTNWAQSGQP